jgi:hypothetical protein
MIAGREHPVSDAFHRPPSSERVELGNLEEFSWPKVSVSPL